MGSNDGGVVTLSNCYKVPHKEDEDEVAINMDFNEHLFRLQKKVGPNEVIVGWFTTSKCKFFGQEQRLLAVSKLRIGFYLVEESQF